MIFNKNLYDSSYTTIEAIQKRYEELKQFSGVDEYKKFYEEYNVEEVIIIPTEEKINTCLHAGYKIYDLISSLRSNKLPDSSREEIQGITQLLSDYAGGIGSVVKEIGFNIVDKTPAYIFGASPIYDVIEQSTIVTDLYNGTYDPLKTYERANENYKCFTKGLYNNAVNCIVGLFEIPDAVADIYYGEKDLAEEISTVVKESNGDVTKIYQYAESKLTAIKDGVIETKDEVVDYVKNMDEGDWYFAIGNITFDVALFTLGGASKAAKVSEAAKASEAAKTSEVAKVAETEKIAQTGKKRRLDDIIKVLKEKIKGKVNDEDPLPIKGGSKKGKLTIIDGVENYSISEINAAQYMADLGNDVVLRPPIGTRAGGQTSDLLVNGINYDVYTPTTSNPSAIIRAITKKNTQTTGVVLDLSNTTVTANDLGNILARVKGAIEKNGGTCNINDIVVMQK